MSDYPPLDERHRIFLERLAHDDTFREAFHSDPGATLVEYRLLAEVTDSFPCEAPSITKEEAAEALAKGVFLKKLNDAQFFAPRANCAPAPGGPPGRPKPPRP